MPPRERPQTPGAPPRHASQEAQPHRVRVRCVGTQSPQTRRQGLWRRARNDTTLIGALAKVLTGKTMPVSDAAEAVQKAGYRTNSNNFRTQVNTALIKEPFKRAGRGMCTAKQPTRVLCHAASSGSRTKRDGASAPSRSGQGRESQERSRAWARNCGHPAYTNGRTRRRTRPLGGRSLSCAIMIPSTAPGQPEAPRPAMAAARRLAVQYSPRGGAPCPKHRS